MAKRIRLLIVDDEAPFLRSLSERLSLRDFDVVAMGSGEEALAAAQKQEFDLALVDLRMPGMSGEELLEALKKQHPLTEVVILTGHGSIDSAVRCTQAGSYTYLQKPCEMGPLLDALRQAYEKRIQRKYEVGESKLREVLGLALCESSLGVLMRLRDIDEKGL
ncbi:MAG: response regulator [Deltaproteobacteria bacterium]|nr:response regulator [Deltaproteobacteria bacterium]